MKTNHTAQEKGVAVKSGLDVFSRDDQIDNMKETFRTGGL